MMRQTAGFLFYPLRIDGPSRFVGTLSALCLLNTKSEDRDPTKISTTF